MLRGWAAALAILLGLVLLPGPGAVAADSLTLDPARGPAGSTIRLTPVVDVAPQTCVAEFDGGEVARFACGRDAHGNLSTDLVVPPAAPGPHTIRVCDGACGGIEPAFEVSAPFTVLAVVPDLGSLNLAEARAQLRRSALVLGTVEGPATDPAARVTGQDPAPGSPVDGGSAVSLTVAVPVTLVTVPDLRRRTRAQAAALLRPLGLVLLVRSGTGRVERQEPAAGDQVAPGSAVEVTLRAVPPPALVIVPDLRRRALAEAEAAVRAAGLVLRVGGQRSGTVATQTPAPGSRAPRGSVVAVTMAAAPAPATSRSWTPVAVALAMVLLALAASAAGVRRLRSRRSRRWVRRHVRVTASADLGGADATEVEEVGDGATRSIGLQPHADRGSQALEEVRR